MDRAPSRPLLGVSVCLVRQACVLVVERSRPPFAGRLSLPGGKVRTGEFLDAAARRELSEETGIMAGPLDFLRLHEAIDERSHAVIAVFCGCVPADAAPRAGDDAAAVHYMTPAEIADAEADGRTTPGLHEVVVAAAGRIASEEEKANLYVRPQ